MRIDAEFIGAKPTAYLKPHIAIKCFVGKLALEPTAKKITSLIKVTLGNSCNHPNFPVSCVALDETAAEKWVALTRRVAVTQQTTRQSDQHLVRHLYDLYQLSQKRLLTGEYNKLIHQIMEKDRQQSKKHHEAYVNNPLQTSQQALELLFNDPKWQEHWKLFLEQMVYDKNKPNFTEACEQLRTPLDFNRPLAYN